MTRPPTRRLIALLVVMGLALGGVVVRLGVLEVRQSGHLVALGSEQRMRDLSLPASRGVIEDREGQPLAMTLDARDVYADPSLVTDPAGEAARIAPILGTELDWTRASLSANGTFVYLARQVDREVADGLAALRLPGIGFQDSDRRYYPGGSLAAQVLGFVGVDGDGLAGLEAQYDGVLAGTAGERRVEVGAQGQEIAGGLDRVTPARPGDDVVLTIDREIQFLAQQYLRRAVRQNHAKGGTIVVLDPRTGDVYAMASYPSYDPNAFASATAQDRMNRAVTSTWEPGSVNKVITAAAALETGAASPTQRFHVPWTRTIGGFTIHDAEPHPVERMTIGDIIAHSSNIGASMLADRVGNAGLQQYFARFGYGEPTGVGFPGEARGIMPTGEWEDITRATISFGAGVAVTPLQMATVYATVANGGTWVQPRLVLGTRAPDGTFTPAAPSSTRRVLRPDTADLLARMLAYVVQDGTGRNAEIPGYQVAGKTGTAKKLDRQGRYTHRYVASFIGFLPAARPRVVVAAVIDEPDTIYGGVAAAPLFQDVARYAIQRLGIEPAPSLPLPPHALPAP
jgi:cell division protein FtsI (penicillin-binding protein 3)